MTYPPAEPSPQDKPAPERVEALFHQALEMEPAARAAFLDQACGVDGNLRHYVEELLASSAAAEENPGWQEPAIVQVARASAEAEEPTLDRYRLLERIGTGGMGIVYKAVRSDDAYSKEVAIKIVQWAAGDEAVLQRFRTERQILANLEHPNIARLLDGGTTADGSPFLAMEFIQGVSIDRFVAERKPTLRTLLELFRRICAAVGYAHRNLVVHRDLKPGNILVAEGPDGIPEPKLLDFGIARLLDDSDERTRTRTMTIEYASPEQVSGAPIGTASDIYSLGVLLYELVSGARPYRATTSAMDLAAAICKEDPQPLRAGVDPDLANIILMAMRKEPARRYESAEQVAEDLRRFLEGYPVTARPDTRTYRARKFVGRNKLAIAAAVLVLLTLAGGVAATMRQSRIATSRFMQVRKLAHSVLFDYHDAVATLPGSVAIRTRLVKDGLEYLDALSNDAGGDQGLRLELATAYLKVGDVQARPLRANLGDTPGGLASYRKATLLFEQLVNKAPGSESMREDLALAYQHSAELSQSANRFAAAADGFRKAAGLLESLCATRQFQSKADLYSESGDAGDRRTHLADVYSDLGNLEKEQRRAAEAQTWFRKALALYAQVGTDRGTRLSVAATHNHIGGVLTDIGDVKGALAEFQQTLAIDLELARPSDATELRDLALAYHNVGVGFLGTREFDAALNSFREAGTRLEALVKADPADANIHANLADNTRRIAETLNRMERSQDSAAAYAQAIGMYGQLVAADPGNAAVRSRYAVAYLAASLLYDRTHDGRNTADMADHAVAIFEPLSLNAPGVLPLLARARYEAGKGRALLGQWPEAHQWYEKSVTLWHDLRDKGQLAGTNPGRITEAELGLAESAKHLH